MQISGSKSDIGHNSSEPSSPEDTIGHDRSCKMAARSASNDAISEKLQTRWHDQQALEAAFTYVKYHVNVLLATSSLGLAFSIAASEINHNMPDSSGQVTFCRRCVSVTSVIMLIGIITLLFGEHHDKVERHLSKSPKATTNLKTSIFWVTVHLLTNCLHIPTLESSSEMVQWEGLFFLLRTFGWTSWVLHKLHLEQ